MVSRVSAARRSVAEGSTPRATAPLTQRRRRIAVAIPAGKSPLKHSFSGARLSGGPGTVAAAGDGCFRPPLVVVFLIAVAARAARRSLCPLLERGVVAVRSSLAPHLPQLAGERPNPPFPPERDRKSTRLNSSHV